MSFLKIAFLSVIIFFIALNEAEAQWSIGASYENRGETPTNGFGFQLEKDLLPAPLLFIRTRAHYSYFNESNTLSVSGITYTREVSSYDVGLAAIAGANIAMLSPYGGMGLGLENYKRNGIENESYKPRENEFYLQAIIGLGLNIIPAIKPFVEMRYSGFSDTQEIPDSQRRFIAGVAFRF